MGYIENFNHYVSLIKDESKKLIFVGLIERIKTDFPELKLEIRWNQPMFVYQDTFILAVSVLKNHMSIAPEIKAMDYFRDEIKLAGYEDTRHLFKINFRDSIHYPLIERIIKYNIKDKTGYKKFWREA